MAKKSVIVPPETMAQLIAKGLIEQYEEDGETRWRLSEKGYTAVNEELRIKIN